MGGPTYNVTFLSAFLSSEFETKLIGGSHESHEGDALFIPHNYGLQPEIINVLERSINFKNDRAALKKIRQIIREFNPQIVHTHASKAGAIGRYAAHKEKVPVIVHTFHGHVFHSYFGRIKTYIYKSVERYMAKKSDAIIAISKTQAKELVEDHKITTYDKIKIIPLGFDLDRFNIGKEEKRNVFRSDYKLKDNDIAIGLIGRFAPIKNHHGFVDSMVIAAQQTEKNIVVFFIGDGELRNELELKIESIQNIRNLRFEFTSWIKDVDRVLPGLDIVALSSFNEGTPVSLIEAQAAGVPVVSTDVGGVRDIVADGKTGIITGQFETKTYATALLDLIENEEKRKQMSLAGWNSVESKFHYKRLCSDMEALYNELLKKKDKKLRRIYL